MDAPPHNTQEQWSREITINSYSADQDGNGRHTSEADEPGMEDVQKRFERERRSWKEKEMVYEERIEELERRQRLSEQEFKVRIGRLEADLALRTAPLAASVTAAKDLLAGKGGVTLEGADDIEELAASPRLPVELLAKIAGFLAGDNDYTTLIALTYASRTVSSVLVSTLYETVFWGEALNKRMEIAVADGVHPPNWKYTRYIVVDQHFWRHDPTSVDAAFVNLRACIVKKKDFPHQRTNGEASAPQYTVDLEMRKDTTLAVLSSILRHPLRWWLAGEPPRYNVARGVFIVKVATTATFSVGNGHPYLPGSLFESTQNETSRLGLRLPRRVGNAANVVAQVEACLRAVSYFVLPTDPAAVGGRPFELRVDCEQTAALDACINQLPGLVGRNKDIWLAISLSTSDGIPRNEFLIFIDRFARVYQVLCRDAIPDIDPEGPVMTRPLLQLRVNTSGIAGRDQYRVQMMRHRGQRGFEVKAEELRGGTMAVCLEKDYLPLGL